jgi:hypothetical protein
MLSTQSLRVAGRSPSCTAVLTFTSVPPTNRQIGRIEFRAGRVRVLVFDPDIALHDAIN